VALQGRQIAIVDDMSNYGKGLPDETRKVMNQAAKKEALNAEYQPGNQDDSDPRRQAQSRQYRCALSRRLPSRGIHHPQGDARPGHEKTRLVSSDSMLERAFWAAAGDAAQGTLVTFPPDPRRTANAASVVAEFRAKSVDPEGYTLFAYGALQAWAQAVTAAKSIDFDPVVVALEKGTFRNVLGDFHFNDKGDVNLPSYVGIQVERRRVRLLRQQRVMATTALSSTNGCTRQILESKDWSDLLPAGIGDPLV
jgi:branched-chain amino acid transport system substrate-binding protein